MKARAIKLTLYTSIAIINCQLFIFTTQHNVLGIGTIRPNTNKLFCLATFGLKKIQT